MLLQEQSLREPWFVLAQDVDAVNLSVNAAIEELMQNLS